MNDLDRRRGLSASEHLRTNRADDRAAVIYEAAERAIFEIGASSLSSVTRLLAVWGVTAPTGKPLTPAAVERAIKRMGSDWRAMVDLRRSADNDNAPWRSLPEHEGVAVPILHLADCLDILPIIPDASVHLVMGDLPYGTTECAWDSPINLTKLWKELDRILVSTGTAVMFAAQPFTTALASSNLNTLRYSLVWEKNRVNGFLHARNRVLKVHEDILIFSKGAAVHPHQSNKRMVYNPQGIVELGPKIIKSNRKAIRYLRDGHGCHAEGTEYQAATNFPRSILRFAKDEDHLHPTAKPVALLEYLIRTFSNEGDMILDPTCGSGSTLVAAMNCGRASIGIERNPAFHEVARARIELPAKVA